MIKDTLKRIRKQKGYTQDDVANFLNVKRQTYSSYERGVSLPDIETIKKLTYFFNVSINELAEEEAFQSTHSHSDDTSLSTEEGALLLQEKLKGTPLVNEQGVITKEGADIFATFLINNADMLAKLLNDNK